MKKAVIIIGLFFAGMIVGLLGYQESFVTSLSEAKPIVEAKTIIPTDPLRGEFTASFDRLGIVKLLISTGGRLNKNSVVFRLREKGSEFWLVENTYVTDRFIDGQPYPFGFPIIDNSKGKTYEYELRAIDGSSDNTITIQSGLSAFQTEYRYSPALIRHDQTTLIWFLKEKTKEVFGTVPHMGYWMMCLLPLLIFTDVYVFGFLFMILLFGFLPVRIHSNMVIWIGITALIAAIYRKHKTLPFFLSVFVLGICVITYGLGGYAAASKFATILPVLFIGGSMTLLLYRKQ